MMNPKNRNKLFAKLSYCLHFRLDVKNNATLSDELKFAFTPAKKLQNAAEINWLIRCLLAKARSRGVYRNVHVIIAINWY